MTQTRLVKISDATHINGTPTPQNFTYFFESIVTAFFAEIVVKLLVQKGCSHVEVAVNYPASANAHTSALRIRNLFHDLKDVIQLFFDVRRQKAGSPEVFANR